MTAWLPIRVPGLGARGFAVPFHVELESPQYTTPSSQPSLGRVVTITHPFHPLHGQQAEVIRVRRGLDADLIIRLPDGCHAAIAASSTDDAGAPPEEPPPGPPPLLDLHGLWQIVQLLDHLQPQGDGPASDPGP